MSVNVEWKVAGDGRNGIVAEGTYLWDAAKRLGLRLPAECGGRGECDTCAVVVEEGATLLSDLTEAERTRLSPERLAAGERLACQAKVLRGGTVVLRPVPVAERQETTEETAKDFRNEFRQMPLKKKIATLAGLEADFAYEAIKRLADIPFDLFGKGLDLLGGRDRKLTQAERDAGRQADKDKAATAEAKPGGGPEPEGKSG